MNDNVVKGTILVAIGILAAMTGKKLAERGFGTIVEIQQKNITIQDITPNKNTTEQ